MNKLNKLLIISALSVTYAPVVHAESKPDVPGAKSMFREVDRIVKRDFVDVTAAQEDHRYTAAIHGMLDELGKNNKLLSPEDLAWMKGSMKGSIAGIGVVFEKVENLIVVKEVLPEAPAAQTKIAAQDRIIAVDGKVIAEANIKEIAEMIRGTVGTSVELLMQRGTDEWTETITRGTVTIHSVQAFVRSDNVGYIRITNFVEQVDTDLDAALADFAKKNVTGVVLDLRGCPGGLFNMSMAVADRFLGAGQVIVSTRHRDGTTKTERAKTDATYAKKLVVLVDKETASSAEIVAAALRENGRATVVGEKTFGKGTVEKIFELSGGYGLKLTIARFDSPDGNNWQDIGLIPDFVIPSDYRPRPAYTKAPVQDLEKDVQLNAALGVLRF